MDSLLKFRNRFDSYDPVPYYRMQFQYISKVNEEETEFLQIDL